MGIIATNENEIKIYYSSETSIGKQAYAYVSASEKKVLGIDVSKTKVPGSHWVEIADGLNIGGIQKLINREHPDFIKEYGDKKMDLDQHDWLRILEKHPETLAFPVVIMGKRMLMIKSPSDFVKYMEPDTTNQENPD
ncbi:arsenate reductase family protein [Mariniflexile sp.]|uniref:arsenate reductase family protein n=1 Tax=Mariniflexile sp. TaxID=1979402 RepID=UPI00404788A6